MLEREHFKTDLDFERHKLWAPEMMTVAIYTTKFLLSKGLRCCWTDTVTTAAEDLACGRKHDQHRRRVAGDLSVMGWTQADRDMVEKELDEHFVLLAYVTASGKKEIAFCHNNGNGWHFHIAVNAKYKLQEFKG